MTDPPEIVCICGSARFVDEMNAANRELTLAGAIVVAPSVLANSAGHAGDAAISDEQRTALGELHLRKIDLADRVLVVNPGGHIGESTIREIAYAEDSDKPVSYHCALTVGAPGLTTMTDTFDEHSRPEPPLTGSEWETLTGFLDYQRATLAWKTGGLDAEQLGRTVAASTMTLGGMLKHMAYVEDDWFGRWLWDVRDSEPWASVDWDADEDWDWHSAADDSPEQLRTLWSSTVERARDSAERAVADGGLAREAAHHWPDGRAPSLRWILTHMIEEYARHNGHADLIRESIDGDTGE